MGGTGEKEINEVYFNKNINKDQGLKEGKWQNQKIGS